MTDSVVVTARLPRDVSTALDALAREMERSRSWLVNKAIRRYIEEQSEWIAFIKEGEDDLDNGRSYGQAEVEAMFLKPRVGREAA